MISMYCVFDIRTHDYVGFFVIYIDDGDNIIIYKKINRLEVSEDREMFYNIEKFSELRTNSIYDLKYFKLQIYKNDAGGVNIENIKWVKIFHE